MKNTTELYLKDGKTFIRTHSVSEDAFLSDFARLLINCKIGTNVSHKDTKSLVQQAVEICCRLRGLESNAVEDRTIVAGNCSQITIPPMASIDETGEVFCVKP